MLPLHWEKAAKRLDLHLHGKSPRRAIVEMNPPRKVWGEDISHVLLELRSETIKNWGETSLLTDILNPEYVTERLGLPDPKASGMFVAYIALSSTPIPKKDFHVRYPDVAYSIAHDFVLLHEIGHALRGWKEAAADKYAFDRLLLPQNHEAKAMLELWYEKILHPMHFTLPKS